MPTKTQKSRPRSSSQHPTTRQRCNHQTSARLTESCHLRSKCVLPKFGTQRADTQPNIDGRGGVNPNLASTVSTGVKPDVRATGIVVGKAVKVSQQALSQRFSSRAVWACMTCCHSYKHVGTKGKTTSSGRSQIRTQAFWKHLIADGSTLEALFRKLESLQDAPQGKLAGKLCTVIDLLTRLPVQVWFHTNPLAHEFPGRFAQFHPCLDLVDSRPWVLRLWIFVRLIAKQVDFITRIKSNAAFEVERILSSDYTPRPFDLLQNRWQNQPLLRLRLVEVRQGKTMYGYITSVLDPQFFHRMPLLTSTDDGGELKRLSILLNACWD